MKIRVMESPTMVAMMKYMGGVEPPLSQGEVCTAIQQGVLDGGENNEITYVDLKHYEVAPVFSKTQHVMIPDLVIAESAYLERMKPEEIGSLWTQSWKTLWRMSLISGMNRLRRPRNLPGNMESPLWMWISNRSRKTAKSFMRRPPAVLIFGKELYDGIRALAR